ncbi:anthranilate synthase component I family protein [Edaphocola aurantiacus]|uniref:anthranilate synthase component I family protein n=1 Tax=Edaphocola aurantiacus TaxID=2601682 RepID=UPI001C97BB09|nr:anthranilate synthase component I family protein [Edaphocola aurantiacus]
MLNWVNRFSIFAYLDNNAYEGLYNRFELLVGAQATEMYTDAASLKAAAGKHWVFGHLNYDLKNQLYPRLKSSLPAYFDNDLLSFFRPGIVMYIPYGSLELIIESEQELPEALWQQVTAETAHIPTDIPETDFMRNFSKEEYIAAVQSVQQHIVDGDCYELNLCVGAAAKIDHLPALQVYHTLNQQNPAPFSCLYRQEKHWLMSSSPERFLYKRGDTIIAQPMKGTIRRGATPEEDAALKLELVADEKERAENIMIADLMRNDLAKHSKTGTIEAVELFGVQTFPTVHTMVSTIKGTMDQHAGIAEVLLDAFPMGSMTGAPKHMVMQIIEETEHSKRELYSGAVGYITPAGDFDFNVVIRSLLYNEQTGRLSYHTGGAITIDSIPEKEWAEVQLKALALERIFKG